MSNDLAELFAGPATPEKQERLGDLALLLIDAEAKVDRDEAALKESKSNAERLRLELIRRLDEEGLKSFKAHGRSFTPSVKRVFALPPEGDDRDAALAWIRGVGGQDVIKEQVNYQTLGAWCREREQNELPLDPRIKVTELNVLYCRKD